MSCVRQIPLCDGEIQTEASFGTRVRLAREGRWGCVGEEEADAASDGGGGGAESRVQGPARKHNLPQRRLVTRGPQHSTLVCGCVCRLRLACTPCAHTTSGRCRRRRANAAAVLWRELHTRGRIATRVGG
eukprot:2857130-Rhodomonas_salina.1